MSTRTLPRHIRSVGTHNTLDGSAPGTAFADVLCFTEAIPSRIWRDLKKTHYIYVCEQQGDLVICVRRGLNITNVKKHYRLAHPGIRKVTPHRGTFWITFELDGVKHAIVCEHRINAAFPPYKRGEAFFRRRMWRRHTNMTKRILTRLIKQGYKIIAGGDLNTPQGVSGYEGVLTERGGGLDRVGAHGYGLGKVRHLSKVGSDHPRLKARTSSERVRSSLKAA